MYQYVYVHYTFTKIKIDIVQYLKIWDLYTNTNNKGVTMRGIISNLSEQQFIDSYWW